MSLRIYGVDCPELAKTKSQVSQPFAEQAKQFTADLCLHKVVRITLIRKDQYGRAVCVIETMPTLALCSWIPGCGRKDVSLELARAGLAELYTGGGAEYFSRRPQLEVAMERATKQKRGIWSLPANRVSAADHKRLAKQDKADSGQQKPLQSKTQRTPLQERRSGDSRPSRENQKAKVPSGSKASKKYRTALLESAVTGLEFVG
jgi:endonuclease YncB( thermonuclease family)